MAIARDTTAKNIKPLTGAVVRRFTAGATLSPGELFHLSSDSKCDPCNTANITNAAVTGVVLGNADLADGEVFDGVVFGPVNCLTGATPGAVVYATDTAGEPGETAGTKTCVAGYAESATVLFVRPFQTVFS